MKKSLKFGIFADLHVDIIHDTDDRLKVFLKEARNENVDFIIQLGDFCYPDENKICICKTENLPVNLKNALTTPSYANKDLIRSLYKDFEKPSYHVIGNHDCDMCSKKQILEYHDAKYGPFYSFDFGDFHFVVLDANYFMEDGEYYSYENGNYFDKNPGKTRTLPYIPPHELDWLKADLDSTDKPSVIFSHQSLCENTSRAILHADVFRSIIKNRKSPVLICFNGHTHLDGARMNDGVWYMHVNSMSNHWLGSEHSCLERYSPEIDEKFPDIRHVAPYSDSLFAIVEIDESGARIKGRRGKFVGTKPEQLGYYEKRGKELIEKSEPLASPIIEDKYLPFAIN